ncbi:5-hydroxyisourate hydrolase [Klenkia soli]|uniref:5-hydroxyisourate hydrolase n=1 Tax=Klenkia soli TaxID=1052260 RepID=A0A1H0F559_9ACTN|nr:hydroxyisourate hydrolase [Klenkia soli]SDN89733.1 5-hydroxyisourate hydrolase [Klenkia soli]
MSRVTTHVLDAECGRPAAGMPVRLERLDGGRVADLVTDADGRAEVRDVGPGDLRLVFDTRSWRGPRFHPEVAVAFSVTDPAAHTHVPLLLSPFAYTTYRGS